MREARAAAALRHPNVAAIYQFGASPDGSHCYYAMELVEGETLEASRAEGWSARCKTDFGNCDPNYAGIDGSGGSVA